MDVKALRRDFPLLSETDGNKPPVYLDSACTTLKPRQVIEAMTEYYEDYPACGGRSLHDLGTKVTIRLDEARGKVARFVNADGPSGIVFTKNSTEGLNIIANGMGWERGDVVVVSDHEHNSNLVPWLRMARTGGVRLLKAGSRPDNVLDVESFKSLMSSSVRLVSIAHVCNLDGHENPVREVAEIAHDHGAMVILDAAQSAPHKDLDVGTLDVDFMVFSAHKMCGPTGTGVLYGKEESLKALDPVNVGGGCVKSVSGDSYVLVDPPSRFEAGTLNVAGIIGTAAAVDYLSAVGLDEIEAHERALNRAASDMLDGVVGVGILGPADPGERSGILGFNIDGMDPHDVAMILDQSGGIMIRSGMMCNHSWFDARGMKGSARASFYFYNTIEEAELFAEKVGWIAGKFAG